MQTYAALCATFKSNVIAFLDEITEEYFAHHPKFMFARLLLGDLPEQKLIETFETFVMPMADRIRARDATFFVTAPIVDAQVGGSMQGAFLAELRVLWQSGEMDETDKNVVWEWFQSFVDQCEAIAAARPVQ
jgi:hypothetical protein